MKRATSATNAARLMLALGLTACTVEATPPNNGMIVAGVGGAAGVAGAIVATGGMGGAAATAGAAGMTPVAGAAGVAGMEIPAGTTGGSVAGMMAVTGGMTGGSGVPDAMVLNLEPFSFFATSLNAMRMASGSQDGFGGDLSHGETGVGAGLRGADKICTEIAEMSMPGSGAKEWHAFLSAVAAGPDGGPVHAKDRIGNGPWYDRLGRLMSNNLAELIQERPSTADIAIIDDLPNELGVPNHDPDGTGQVDNHDFLTGSNAMGEVYMMDMKVTCNDWTKSVGDSADAPRVGHTWGRTGGPGGGGIVFPGGGGPGGIGENINMNHWISALDEAGCGPSVGIIEMGPPMEGNPTVGSGGGYGGIYCFAMQP